MQSSNFSRAAKVLFAWTSLVSLISVPICAARGANADKKEVKAETKRSSSGTKKSKTEQALVLIGKSDQYGAVKFKICSQAINIVDNLGTALWMASEPDTSYTLNPENHTIFPHKLNFGRLGEVDEAASRRTVLVKVELINKPILLGQKCHHFRAYRQAGSGTVPTVEFWCLDKLPVPAKVNNAWCSLFLLPPQYGFPIQVEPCARSSWAHSFKLFRIEREPVEKLTVRLPANYKMVKDKASLLFGDGSPLKKSDLDDLFRSD